nr:PAS domain-containing protein [Nitrospirota bacterium]
MDKDIKRVYHWLPWLIISVTWLALFMGGLSLGFIQKRLVANAGETLTLTAEDIAEKLDWFLFERYGDVQVLAQTPVFRGNDPEAMAKYLMAVQQKSTGYVWLAVTDRQGRIVASSESSSVGSNRSQAGWFQAARDGLTIVLGDVEPLDEAGGGMDVVAFTAPIVSQQGQFIGVVTARVTLTKLEEILTRTLHSFQRRQGVQGSIDYQFLTHEGLAFVDSDLWHKGSVNLLKLGLLSAQLSESGQSGFVEEEHLRLHVPVVTGYARTMGIGTFRGLDWRVLVRANRAEILSPIADAMRYVTLAGLIVLGPLVGLLLWTAKHVRMESEQTSAQLARLQGLNRVNRALENVDGFQGTESALTECLQLVIETSVQLAGARYGAVGQFDESGKQLVQFITTGIDETTKSRIGELPTGRGLLGFLAQEGDVLRLKDLTRHPTFSGFPPHHPPMGSFLGVSIRAHGRLFGRIYLTEKRGADEFSEIDEQVIAALASEAGVAIENGIILSQIRTAELLYRTTMSALPVSVVRLDLQGTIQFANPRFYELIQRNQEDTAGRTVASVLYSEGQLDEIGEMLRTVRAHGEQVTREVAWVHPTGERRSLRLCAAGMKPAAAAAEFVLIIEDITEYKRAEKVLYESRDFYLKLFDEFPALIWRAGLDTKCDYFNSAWLEFTGRTLEQERGDGWAEGVHPDDLERCVTTYQEAFSARRLFEMEYRLRRHDGEYRWIMDVGRPFHDLDGTFAGYIGSCYDVTERRRAEELLRQSEASLVHAQRIAHLGSWNWNLTTNELVCSDEIYRMFGVALQQIGFTYEAFVRSVHPDDRAFVVWSMEEALSNYRPYNIDYRILLPDGTERAVHEQAEIIRDDQGRAVRIVGTAQDVTESRQAEAALRESEEQFRQFAETINQVFWMTTPDKTRMLYVSPAYEEIWGTTCENLYASPLAWAEAIHPDDRERVMEAAQSKQVSGTYHEEYRIVRPDGSVRWILDRAFPVRDESGAVYRIIGVAKDITDRKQMEERLRHSQKMEAMGQLAGSITHDFNNLLTVITGNSEMLLFDLPQGDPQFDSIQEIRQASERATALTHQLLAFSRKQAVRTQRVDLNVVIAEIEAILRRLLGEPIELVTSLATDLGCVMADIGQLEQVVLNLVVNARDAMPEGGRIIIETTNLVVGEAGGHRHSHLHPGSYVLLVVSDNGVGMDEATRSRIFEPFFTTKPKGQGTGLGLSTVHGIVDQSGGHIEIHSQPGRGTTFTIFLPRADDAADEVHFGSQPHKIQGGDETILLVEDEDLVRALVGDILRSNGYTVLEACHGDEALQVSREYAGTIHLLLTDVIMPDMNGDQLSKCLTPTRPDMKVLFMSGYTGRSAFYQQVLAQGGVFLQKPFTPHVLAAKVREALASSKQGVGS